MNKRYVEYTEDLQAAQKCSQRALEALLRPTGPKRGFWYRWRLRRAQNALMSLYKEEISIQERETHGR